MHRQLRYLALLLFALQSFDCGATAAEPSPIAERSQAILIESLQTQREWSSVHAAEYLIRLDELAPVLAAFRSQAESETPQYRIGVWRVLAQAETTPQTQNLYVQRIRDVLLDLQAEDRLHALESLAKLHAPIASPTEEGIVQQLAHEPDYPGRAFAVWRLIQENSSPELVQALLGELESSDDVRRLRAAFVLGQLDDLPQASQEKLRSTFAKESRDSIVFPYLAIATSAKKLSGLTTSENPTHQALALKELTQRGVKFEYDFALGIADQSPLALRQAAAFALLAKQRKRDVQQNP